MISIIIPAHNEKQNLEKLLPYLSKITAEHKVEIIVVLSSTTNDGSGSLPSSASTKFIRCNKSGRAVQMNYGVEMAQGKCLVFLHADVTPPLDFIMDIKKTLDAEYEAGFFSYKFDKESFLLNINASFTARDGIFTGGGDQCLFINTATFTSLGMFDEAQVIMEDFEFFKRMKRNDIRYKIVKNDLMVSSRKYQSNSYLKVNASNLLMVILFKLGYPSKKLKSLHHKLLKMPYTSEK